MSVDPGLPLLAALAPQWLRSWANSSTPAPIEFALACIAAVAALMLSGTGCAAESPTPAPPHATVEIPVLATTWRNVAVSGRDLAVLDSYLSDFDTPFETGGILFTVFRRNVIVGGVAGRYPPDNFFPASLEEAGLAVPRDGDLRLSLARPYTRAATDGRAPGVDLDALTRALDGIAPTAAPARARAGGASGDVLFGTWPADLLAFALALALLVYIYVGYPLLAMMRARCWPKPRRRLPIEPRVSIVVVAHNEADRIAARIENLLALDYPRDKLEIVIGSDGSTDETVARALGYEPCGIIIHNFARRRGKPATVNAVVPLVRGDIVVFADARQRFEPGALRALTANFADPRVGAASGELVLAARAGTATAGHGARVYWRYEKAIRSAEGRSDSTVGATGAIYAIRRSLFERIPDDTLLDDVLIPLRIVKAGYRVVFEPEARAHDIASMTARQEFVRKTRTIAGTFQLLARETWLLNPFRNRLWFETVSHKVLRLGLPILHAALLASTIALAGTGVFGLLLVAQLLFYGCAFVGAMQRDGRRHSMVFSAPCATCLLLWATVVGFHRFATRRQQVTWEREYPLRRRVPIARRNARSSFGSTEFWYVRHTSPRDRPRISSTTVLLVDDAAATTSTRAGRRT